MNELELLLSVAIETICWKLGPPHTSYRHFTGACQKQVAIHFERRRPILTSHQFAYHIAFCSIFSSVSIILLLLLF